MIARLICVPAAGVLSVCGAGAQAPASIAAHVIASPQLRVPTLFESPQALIPSPFVANCVCII